MWLTAVGLLLFCGAVGKSAQFPLHVWLPDAMEGPTPVSALIHAATMVAAGVYMLCRTLFLFNADSLHVISYIGGFTALLAALMAVQQNDIKRIIAYSTLSQLGYMVMTVGLNGPTPAMFHLTTHAFFKALTGVGPSMASGSQTCSGNCALLPIAPQKISKPAVVASAPKAWGLAVSALSIRSNLREPKVAQTVRMPSKNPKSPRRVVMKAFLPASAAAGRSNQKPMSK